MIRTKASRRALLIGAGSCVGLFGAPAAWGEAPPAPVWSVQFSPDGKTLAVGAYKEVRLYDVAGKSLIRSLKGPSGPVRCLAWSADGSSLVAGGGLPGELGEVKVWKGPFDAARPAKPVSEMKEHRDLVEGVAFSSDGEALITASDDEKALAFSLADRKVIGRMQDHNSRVVAVAVSQSGKFVATGSLDKTVKIWSSDYKPLANIDNRGLAVLALAFLPQDVLALAGEDGTVRLYRLQESRTGALSSLSANQVRSYNGNRVPVNALAFGGPKAGWLATGSEDHVVNVYDMSSGNRKYQLKESPAPVYSVAVSPDGALVAAGCRDGKVRLWTTADGKPAGEL